MKKKLIPFLFLVLFVLVLGGCKSSSIATNLPISSLSPTTEHPSETPAPTETASPTLTATLLPTETQTPLPPPTLSPTDSPFLEVQQQCLEVREDFQPSMLTEGSVIFLSDLFSTNEDSGPEVGNGVGRLTSQGMEAYPQFRFPWDASGYALSTDQKYMAYVSADNLKLVVINATGETIVTVPWQNEWIRREDYFGILPRWLDNTQVIFNADVNNPGSVNVLNPFTGKNQNIGASFPNIFQYASDGGGNEAYFISIYWGDPNFAEFNATFTRSAYLEGSSEKTSLVLWNPESNSELWRWTIPVDNFISHPVWYMDGTYFIAALPVALGDPGYFNHSYYELFSITQDGNPTQLTNFKAEYPFYATILGDMVWSPDNKYLAFNLLFNQDENYKTKLMLYDQIDKKILDYCLTGDEQFSVPAQVYWSPDSQQLILKTARYSEDLEFQANDIFLVDPENGYMVKLGENWQIVGWMADDK